MVNWNDEAMSRYHIDHLGQSKITLIAEGDDWNFWLVAVFEAVWAFRNCFFMFLIVYSESSQHLLKDDYGLVFLSSPLTAIRLF